MTSPTDYYQLSIITPKGELDGQMYARGERTTTPELARQLRGAMRAPRDGERIAVVFVRRLPGLWTDAAGHEHQRYDAPIVVEILTEEL